MKKLKLQMQISVDGFVAGPNGELDWMTWQWDDKLKSFTSELTDSVDTILMGRNMTDGFVNYWTSVLDNPASEEYAFAKKMVDYPKHVFTRTLTASAWANTTLKHDLAADINAVKSQDGKDAIVYGGAGFVTSLIRENLIDDYYLYVNPTAIGNGMTIFGVEGYTGLKLVSSRPFECGIVINHYRRA